MDLIVYNAEDIDNHALQYASQIAAIQPIARRNQEKRKTA